MKNRNDGVTEEKIKKRIELFLKDARKRDERSDKAATKMRKRKILNFISSDSNDEL